MTTNTTGVQGCRFRSLEDIWPRVSEQMAHNLPDEFGAPFVLKHQAFAKAVVEQYLAAAKAVAPILSGEAEAGPAGETAAWRDMASAPKDGTLLALLVRPYANDEEGAWTPFEDSRAPQPTIGFNNFDDTEEDRWQFAGWNWSQDCIVEGDGEVVGWAPFARPVEEPGEVERYEEFGTDDATYEIGKRDGYEEAVQHIDERTGGDGEYVAVAGFDPEERNCPDGPSMVARIVRRFEVVEHRAETAEAALAANQERLEKETRRIDEMFECFLEDYHACDAPVSTDDLADYLSDARRAVAALTPPSEPGEVERDPYPRVAGENMRLREEIAAMRERSDGERIVWRRIAATDREVATIQTFGDVTLRNSHPAWVRDADGRTYEAVWTVDGKGRGYWWDTEGESPTDPIEICPHPLTERAALTGDVQERGR